jgi:hypothetical protein
LLKARTNGKILIWQLTDFKDTVKSVINSVNKKLKDRCNSLIYSGLYFEVVVPPADTQIYLLTISRERKYEKDVTLFCNYVKLTVINGHNFAL